MAQHTEGLTIYDACCGLGGNSLAFAQAGATVIAVEQNPEIIALARKNAKLYNVTAKIRFIQGDTLRQAVAADVCFVDPPWGVDWNRIQCGLDDFPLAAMLWERFLHSEWREFWLKVPSSFDPGTLHAKASVTPYFGVRPGDCQRIKFVLLTVSRNDLNALPE